MSDDFRSSVFLEILKKREPEAIRKLVEAYHLILFKAAIGQLKDAVLAEDVVQDTWSTFFADIERFEGRSHIRTYLFGIMYNKVREKRRDVAKYILTEEPDPVLDFQFSQEGYWKKAPMDPEEFTSGLQNRQVLELCLETLGEKQRQAFYLKEVLGEATSDICKILDLTVTNLGVLIYRAKNHLRICLESKIVRD